MSGSRHGQVVDTLHEAVALARERGLEVTGWTLQSSPEGYAAWLYVELDDTQHHLEAVVDVHRSPTLAARACLASAATLTPPRGVPDA